MHVWFTLATINTKIAIFQNYSSTEANISALNDIYQALSYKDNLNYLVTNNKNFASSNMKEFIKNISFRQHLNTIESKKVSELTNLILKLNLLSV
ncbi:hypothetical protein D3C75_1181200 [compost metagenome]